MITFFSSLFPGVEQYLQTFQAKLIVYSRRYVNNRERERESLHPTSNNQGQKPPKLPQSIQEDRKMHKSIWKPFEICWITFRSFQIDLCIFSNELFRHRVSLCAVSCSLLSRTVCFATFLSFEW